MKNGLFQDIFHNPVVVIDDEIGEKESEICQIRDEIRKLSIPTIDYDDIPDEEVIKNLSNISFIIMDWNFEKCHRESFDFGDIDEEIEYPDGMKREDRSKVISFVKSIIENYTVPVFFFTAEATEEIKEIMTEEGIEEAAISQIFFCEKTDLLEPNAMVERIIGWIEERPAVYVLKKWETEAAITKNKLFLDLNSKSTYWAGTVWETIQHDGDRNYEFTSFLNRQFVNRFDTIAFDGKWINKTGTIRYDELREIIQAERYISYDEGNSPKYLHTGDLFVENDSQYWVVVSAQCDLARHKAHKNDNVILVRGNAINVDQWEKILGNESEYYDTRTSVYEMCVADNYLVEFKMGEYKMYNPIREKDSSCKLIGRLLPPNITRIQQKFSSYIVREGEMSIPKRTLVDLYNKENG